MGDKDYWADVREKISKLSREHLLPEKCAPTVQHGFFMRDHNFVNAVPHYQAMGIVCETGKSEDGVRVRYPEGWTQNIVDDGTGLEIRDDLDRVRLKCEQNAPAQVMRRFGLERETIKKPDRQFIHIVSRDDPFPVMSYEMPQHNYVKGAELSNFKNTLEARAIEWGMQALLETALPDATKDNPHVYWNMSQEEVKPVFIFLKENGKSFIDELVNRSTQDINEVPDDTLSAKSYWQIVHPHMEALKAEYAQKFSGVEHKIEQPSQTGVSELAVKVLAMRFPEGYEENLNNARAQADASKELEGERDAKALDIIKQVRGVLKENSDQAIGVVFEGNHIAITTSEKLITNYHENTNAFGFGRGRLLSSEEGEPREDSQYLNLFRDVAADTNRVYTVTLQDQSGNPVPVIMSSSPSFWESVRDMGVAFDEDKPDVPDVDAKEPV